MIAIDFEAEFSTECNLKVLGNWNYARATNIFLVALYCPELELDYVGSLGDAPWHIVRAYPDLVAHHAGFDLVVFVAAQEKGQIPSDIAPRWHCSADLSAYMLLGRALSNAVLVAYGVLLPKEIRTRAKNKRWPDDFSPEKRLEFMEYCRSDAMYSYRLWTDYHSQWPAEERKFAELTRLRSIRGVTIDIPKVKSSLVQLEGLRLLAEAQIPWAGDGGPVLSMRRVKTYCQSEHIIPPESLAEGHHACLMWEEAYGAEYPIVGALRQWRKSNMYAKKLEAMLTRVMLDGRMPVDLKYFGAEATGRMAGSGGWNIQNLPRAPYAGIDIRSLLVPAPGYKFVIADYQAIEPRVTAWLCQSKILSDLSKGHNIYEADARMAGMWDGEQGTLKKSDANLYATIKACSLGLAYGLGIARFGEMVKTQLGLEWTPSQCQEVSRAWHARNPGVKSRWLLLEQAFKNSVLAGETYSIKLPSGRALKYFDPSLTTNRLVASRTVGGLQKRYYWGGTLFENCWGGDTEVLTNRGWLKLPLITLSDLLWDGTEWVSHAGVVNKGFQLTIELLGTRCTPDHLFLTSAGWQSANDLVYGKASILVSEVKPTGSMGRAKVQPFIGDRLGRERWTAEFMEGAVRLREDSNYRTSRLKKGEILLEYLPLTTKKTDDSRIVFSPCLRGLEFDVVSLPEPNSSGFQKIRGSRDFSVFGMGEISNFLGRYGEFVCNRTRIGSDRQRPRVFQGQLPMDSPESKQQQSTNESFATVSGITSKLPEDRGTKWNPDGNLLLSPGKRRPLGSGFDCEAGRYEEVFDILNAGPRHRCTIRGSESCPALIAHNCIQATARDVLRDAILRLESAGIPVVFSAHDEIVAEVPEDFDAREISMLMLVTPSWAKGLPLGVELVETHAYAK